MRAWMTEGALSRLPQEVASILRGEIDGHIPADLKTMVEAGTEVEIEVHLGVKPRERSPSRKGWRNGYYRRDLYTHRGPLRGIRVLRAREGGFVSQILPRFQRFSQSVEKVVCSAYLGGLSTRKIGSALGTVFGTEVSASTVSRMAQAVDGRVREFHSRPLADDHPYLFLDGVTLRLKSVVPGQPQKAPKRLVLVALGIHRDGRKEIIDFVQAPSESEAAWEGFLRHLYERGLRGENLKLIITDGGTGLVAAVESFWPWVSRQLCWVHKMRNVSNKLRKSQRKECLAGARAIYQAPNLREAQKAFGRWKKRWQAEAGAAVACLEKDLDPLLAVFGFPPELRKTLRTTNPVERAFRDVRARTKPISCFENKQSIERILLGVFAAQNQRWTRRPLWRTK